MLARVLFASHPRHSPGWITLSLVLLGCLIPGTALGQTASPACPTVVDIEATDEDAQLLRESLSGGLLAEVSATWCRGARVSLVRSQTEGLLVSVVQSGETVSRAVPSLQSAIVLVESWLLPPDEVSIRPRGTAGAVHSATSNADASLVVAAGAEHHVATRLELNSALSLGGDLALWAGPDVTVTALLTRAFWFGGGLGVVFWASNDRDGVRLNESIPVMRVDLRLGGRLRFGSRVALDLGAGLGISWDRSLAKPVNPYGELLATFDIALRRNFSIVLGLLGRMHMLREANRAFEEGGHGDGEGESTGEHGEPSALSLLAGELRIGASYTFGGGR